MCELYSRQKDTNLAQMCWEDQNAQNFKLQRLHECLTRQDWSLDLSTLIQTTSSFNVHTTVYSYRVFGRVAVAHAC